MASTRRRGYDQWPRLDAEATANYFLHDFGGAAVDRLHPRIEIGTGNGVFAHVAIAPVQLQAAIDQVHLLLGRIPLRHRSLLGSQLLVEVQADELVDHDAHRSGLGRQLGQQKPAVLKTSDRLAESLALLRVLQSLL